MVREQTYLPIAPTIHIVGFSGGLASAVTANIVADANPCTILLYHDTKTEPPDNDRFRAEVVRALDEVPQVREAGRLKDDGRLLRNSRRPSPCPPR